MENELPFDVDLEKFVLSLIVFEEDLEKAKAKVRFLDDSCFQVPLHKDVYRACRISVMNDNVPDIISLSSYGVNRDDVVLATTFDSKLSYTETNYKEKILQLKSLAMRREQIKVCYNSIMKLSKDFEQNPSEVVQETIDNMSNVRSKYRKAKVLSTKATLHSMFTMFKEGAGNSSKYRVRYMHEAVDPHICHLRGQIHTLGARSGNGKTSFATSCMLRQMKAGMKVVYFCGESCKEEILGRIYAHEAGVSFERLLTAFETLTSAEIGRVNQAVKLFASHSENIHIYGDEDYEHSLLAIEEIMENLNDQHGQFDMVYFDYLQLMKEPPEYKGNSVESIAANINGLKRLAGKYRFAGLVMSQLTQEAGKNSVGHGKSNTNKRLRMEDCRGGGAINNASHFVTFLQMMSDDKDLLDSGACRMIPVYWYSDKCRLQGAVKTVLGFDSLTAEFVNQFDMASYNSFKKRAMHRQQCPITKDDDPPKYKEIS